MVSFQSQHLREAVGEEVADGLWALLEDAENTTAATCHLGVCGTLVIEFLLDLANNRVDVEDGLLEIVCEFVAPGVDGLSDNVAAALFGFVWLYFGEGFAGGNCDVGFHQCQEIACKVAIVVICGFEYFTLSLCEGCLGGDEESAVCSQQCRIALHFGNAHVQVEHFVEQSYHVCRVARTASHAGLCGNAFAQVCMNAWKPEVFGKQVVGSYHQIARLIALNGHTCDFQVTRCVAGEVVVHLVYG